ncbi:MAG: hypothetical protein C0623_05605 [Desulfuromonas sp.]|nr:MAG: hypothetical protein C0623_05605 [Desulfuromonas sp.]
MIWSRALVCLIAVISLLVGAIWPNAAVAAAAPEVVPLGSIDAEVSIPGKLDVDAAGNLYVADIGSSTVLKFSPFGYLEKTYGSVEASGRGLAVSPDGSKLYVATADQVAVLDGETGAVVNQIAFAKPGEIDLDADGNIYVVDPVMHQVQVFDVSGAPLRVFGSTGFEDGQFRTVTSMSVNNATAEVFVGGFQSAPNDGGYATIQTFTLAGAFSGKLYLEADLGNDLGDSSGIAFDGAGREYYLDKLAGEIQVRSTSGGFAPVVFDIAGDAAGRVVLPWDIAYDALTSRLFVSSDSGKIKIFGVDGGVTPEKNVAPTRPTLISPIADSEATSLRPQLRFANATDLNGDALTYRVSVSGATSVSYTVAGDASGETVVQIDEDLAENAAYSWQVQASDGELDSAWTDPQSFYVNAAEEAPTAPVLTSALSGEISGADLLAWKASTDGDPLETISYRVELSGDNTFEQMVLSQLSDQTGIALGEFDDYQDLMPGATYFWQVVAIDGSGMETLSSNTGEFQYATAVLSVDANLPDAKVYFGGNAAYSGQYIGTTPLELRDLAAGPYTVVVERAGCETFIAQVEVSANSSVQVNANLLLAVEPALKKASTLRSVKDQLQSGALVAPFIVDFDNDDLADLLVGDDTGSVTLFRALASRGAKTQYAAGEAFDFGKLPDTALFVADWDNDNNKDVLVGAADGTVSIYSQTAGSSDKSPEFDSSFVPLRDSNWLIIDVGAQANPAVVDFDGDLDKDLILGTGDGKLYLYLNKGSDGSPQLDADRVVLMDLTKGSVSPVITDWDADGVKDLLVAYEGSLFRCAPNDDGTYGFAEVLVDASASKVTTGSRYFVADTDSSQGKDVYVGRSDGIVQVMRSAGKEFLPSVTTALLDKLAEVSDLADAELSPVLDEVSTGISDGDFRAAGRALKSVVAASPVGSELYESASELMALLAQ